jgi:hypothetical protein
MTALRGLLTVGVLPDGTTIPHMPPGIDLVVVESTHADVRFRHHRDALL